ncbi:DNA polymerase I [hydrothermal vent metagenome]|uniref:DNA-directed DNA polymerase n=1 Tax=hydrothermal vent metagenome TaxID=652676 RepID=A0A3B1CLI9_9ZZZZ
MPEKKPTLYLIDGAGFYFRAFFAIRDRLTNARGTPTNAVYGFALMIKKIIKERAPDYIVMTLDSKEKTFRHKMYDQYKANRPQMPDDLAAQLPLIDRLIDGYNIAILRVPGWEADDLIGSISRKAADKGFDVVIVSSDKDLMQLVGPQVSMFDSMKDRDIGPDEVMEKFGVAPEKVTDILGLMGDTSDNIPGVPGVGEKTATALIKEYGDMESVLMAAKDMKKKRLRENLMEFADQARLSKELATIATDAPIEIDTDSWKTREVDDEKLTELFAELQFNTLLKDLKASGPKTPRDYECVLTDAAFKKMIGEMRGSAGFAVDVETTSINPMNARLVGISFSAESGVAYYLPLRHDYEGAPDQLPLKNILPDLKKLLEDEDIPKFGQNIKYDMIVLASEGIDVKPVGLDTMIASYLLNPAGKHNLLTLAMENLGVSMVEYSDVCGKGAKQITFNKVELEKAVEYAAEDADITYRLVNLLGPKIEEEGFNELMNSVETPLIDTLVEIERNGVLLDKDALLELSVVMGDDIRFLEEKIYKEAGEEFNLNSPKQLGHILFEKLKLPGGRKTKTGFSTGQDTLEWLMDKSDLPRYMLEYRQLAKLKNTYVDALPRMINEKTGRIHTSFNQAVTQTGRLSSSNPNLQNIPIRTPLGRKIRKAFIAPEGHALISADYSQIELRLLAHFSHEKTLIEAFHNGEDIHKSAAADIFGVAPPFVTDDMRRVAKTVNFGVIYGQTAFGLATELKIPRGDAQKYIDSYFDKYPGIKIYIDKTIEETKKLGYVSTLLGRRRPLPDINASNRQARNFAERNAVNTPMQGSAADLIKMAMINIGRRLKEENFKTRMTLQVHDELVFETPESEIAQASEMVKTEMEGVWELDVPLIVQVNSGKNWDEAH